MTLALFLLCLCVSLAFAQDPCDYHTIHTTTVHLRWHPPVPWEAPVVAYQLTQVHEGGAPMVLPPIEPSVTQVDVSNLPEGRTHWELAAVYPGEVTSVQAPHGLPPPCVTVVAVDDAPTEVKIQAAVGINGTAGLLVSWQTPPATSLVEIQRSVDQRAWTVVAGARGPQYFDTFALAPATTYWYRLRNREPLSVWSVPVAGTTLE